MSFSKFKLDKKPPRSTPLPIAPACPTSAVLQSKPTPYNTKNTAMPRKSTSCLACKASKTRCETQTSRPAGPCSRCRRLSKRCVFDARLAGITSSTASPARLSPSSGTSRASSRCDEAFDDRSSQIPAETSETLAESTLTKVRKIQVEASSVFLGVANQSNLRPLPSIEDKQLQIKINSLITREAARRVFYHFMDSFAPKCPAVLFPAGTTVETLGETKPVLLLSILSVASAGFCPVDQQEALILESKCVLADRAFVRGEKSLELVQALQVSTLWFRAPESFKQINFNQLARVMITMAIDLDLENADFSHTMTAETAWERAERQRAWLACFIISESISLVLRQSKMLSWSSNMEELLTSLQSAQVSPSDEFFCELVKLELAYYSIDQRLFLSKRQQSTSAHNASAGDTAELTLPPPVDWESCTFNELQRALINFGQSIAVLYAREPAMHHNHNIGEFAAPFALKSLKTCTFIHAQTSAAELILLQEIMTESHALLNCFLGISLVDMLALPPHIYGGRVIYSLIVLCKLYKAIKFSTIDMSAVLPAENIRLEEYLERLGAVAKDLMIRDERNCLSRSFLIVEELRKWQLEESKSTQSCPNMRSGSGFRNSDSGQQAPLSAQPYVDPGLGAHDQNTAIAEQSATQLLHSEGSESLFWNTQLSCDWFLDNAFDIVDIDMPL